MRIEESIQLGDQLLCVQRATTTSKRAGIRTELLYTCVYSFGDGERIAEVNEYATREEALAAAQMKA